MSDERERAARRWAGRKLGWRRFDFAPASSDASFRRYFRATRTDDAGAVETVGVLASSNDSAIVMDAPPALEPIASFIDVRRRLAAAGLNVPAIRAADTDRGFLLLDDLGDRPWHTVLDADNAEAMFDDAIAALVRMQRNTETDGLPEYDAGRLLAELELFPEWFLARHWRVEPSEAELDAWELVSMTLLRWALDQPRVFCHRDFMPRNLMLAEPNPGILDFQDAVLGPISYDPVCLFRDAFLSWSTAFVDERLEGYRAAAQREGLPVPEDPQLWRRTCDLMGVHRHLKVLGIFARIRYRDGKPRYLADEPRFVAYLADAIARNPELEPLDRLLKAWRARARVGL